MNFIVSLTSSAGDDDRAQDRPENEEPAKSKAAAATAATTLTATEKESQASETSIASNNNINTPPSRDVVEKERVHSTQEPSSHHDEHSEIMSTNQDAVDNTVSTSNDSVLPSKQSIETAVGEGVDEGSSLQYVAESSSEGENDVGKKATGPSGKDNDDKKKPSGGNGMVVDRKHPNGTLADTKAVGDMAIESFSVESKDETIDPKDEANEKSRMFTGKDTTTSAQDDNLELEGHDPKNQVLHPNQHVDTGTGASEVDDTSAIGDVKKGSSGGFLHEDQKSKEDVSHQEPPAKTTQTGVDSKENTSGEVENRDGTILGATRKSCHSSNDSVPKSNGELDDDQSQFPGSESLNESNQSGQVPHVPSGDSVDDSDASNAKPSDDKQIHGGSIASAKSINSELDGPEMPETRLNENDEKVNCHVDVKNGDLGKKCIEFSIEPIVDLFTCRLCNGVFRDPYTINKQCLHTFCKSCLVLNMDRQGVKKCPECHEYLGNDWTKYALPDRALQHLIDDVLFTELAAIDEENERAFYKESGIKRKPEKSIDSNNNQSDGSNPTSRQRKRARTADSSELRVEQIHLAPKATPSGSKPEALDKPYLAVPEMIRIGQLKKYLAMKVGHSTSLLGEIFCNGALLGNEWTLAFVKRTIWIPGEDEEGPDANPIMTLYYR